jgi:pyruvate dehydrogenase E2 component (dihydrolipoamide acetyltransferase)
MEEGAFVAWLKTDGELVKAGEPLFSIEGDKAVQEIESIDSGFLRIAANGPKSGDPVRVGDLLGRLLSPDEVSAQPDDSAGPHPSPGAATAAGQEAPAASQATVRSHAAAPEDGRDPVPHAGAGLPAHLVQPSRVPNISPRALRVAVELGVDWTGVVGTGRTGRIREGDVRAAAREAGRTTR